MLASENYCCKQRLFRHQQLMKIKILLPCVCLLIISCGIEEKKFDKLKWNDKEDGFYLNRESVINDVMENHLRKKMTYQEIIKLLGEPAKYGDSEPNTMVYEIMVDYGWNIDPMEGNDLYIELSKDSTLVNYKLEQWKH